MLTVCCLGSHSLAAAVGLGVVWGTPSCSCTLVVPMANIVWGTPGGRCTLVVPAANGVVDCLEHFLTDGQCFLD
jgi:hypothetical protein